MFEGALPQHAKIDKLNTLLFISVPQCKKKKKREKKLSANLQTIYENREFKKKLFMQYGNIPLNSQTPLQHPVISAWPDKSLIL